MEYTVPGLFDEIAGDIDTGPCDCGGGDKNPLPGSGIGKRHLAKADAAATNRADIAPAATNRADLVRATTNRADKATMVRAQKTTDLAATILANTACDVCGMDEDWIEDVCFKASMDYVCPRGLDRLLASANTTAAAPLAIRSAAVCALVDPIFHTTTGKHHPCCLCHAADVVSPRRLVAASAYPEPLRPKVKKKCRPNPLTQI